MKKITALTGIIACQAFAAATETNNDWISDSAKRPVTEIRRSAGLIKPKAPPIPVEGISGTVGSSEKDIPPDQVHCIASKLLEKKMKVVPQVVAGTKDYKPQYTEYHGHKLAAIWDEGSKYNPQKVFWMILDSAHHKSYDPSPRSHYLGTGEVSFSCYVGDERSSGRIQPNCWASQSGENRLELPVDYGFGECGETVHYNDHKLCVSYYGIRRHPGDAARHFLRLRLDAFGLSVTVPQGSLHKLSIPDGTEIQCYNRNGSQSH